MNDDMPDESLSFQLLYDLMQEKQQSDFSHYAFKYLLLSTIIRTTKRLINSFPSLLHNTTQKRKNFSNQVRDQLLYSHQDRNQHTIVKDVQVALCKKPFFDILLQKCHTIFLQGNYMSFRCNPLIICKAIIATKDFHWPGHQLSANRLLQIIIESYQKSDFMLSDRDASELYRIAGQVSIDINHKTQTQIRLHFSISYCRKNYKAITLLLKQYLRNFSFKKCHQFLFEKTDLFEHQKFKVIRYFTAVCIDPTGPGKNNFISILHEEHSISYLYMQQHINYEEKYFRFDTCCGYYMYLAFEPQSAYLFFRKWYYIVSDVASLEGMYLCSYRMKYYKKALKQYQQLLIIMPYQSGWVVIIAAACIFKLGDEKMAVLLLQHVQQNNLSFEEDVFYCGVLCLVGQQVKAVKRLQELPQHINSIMNMQRAIVMLLCEQKLGNSARVDDILKFLPYLEKNERSIDYRFMEVQQILFLANFYFQRSRFTEGRRYVRKARQMGESLKKIASIKAVQRLMEELNDQKRVEVELIFR